MSYDGLVTRAVVEGTRIRHLPAGELPKSDQPGEFELLLVIRSQGKNHKCFAFGTSGIPPCPTDPVCLRKSQRASDVLPFAPETSGRRNHRKRETDRIGTNRPLSTFAPKMNWATSFRAS